MKSPIVLGVWTDVRIYTIRMNANIRQTTSSSHTKNPYSYSTNFGCVSDIHEYGLHANSCSWQMAYRPKTKFIRILFTLLTFGNVLPLILFFLLLFLRSVDAQIKFQTLPVLYHSNTVHWYFLDVICDWMWHRTLSLSIFIVARNRSGNYGKCSIHSTMRNETWLEWQFRWRIRFFELRNEKKPNEIDF